MLTTKTSRCKVCRAPFLKRQSFESWCSTDCAAELGLRKLAKIKKAAELREKRQDKAKREKLKTRSDYIKECQVVANRYARLRDIHAGHGCISCGAPYRGAYGGAFDAGHFRSVGSAPHMRFYLPQIALQCVKCNRYLGGNAIEFRRGLVARRGLGFVEMVESMQVEPKWTVDYLQRFKKVIGKRCRRLELRSKEC